MRHSSRLYPCLLKNTHGLGLKFREFQSEYDSARMENQIESLRQQLNVTPQNFAHPPLDAVALMRLTEYLARGQAHARSNWQ